VIDAGNDSTARLARAYNTPNENSSRMMLDGSGRFRHAADCHAWTFLESAILERRDTGRILDGEYNGGLTHHLGRETLSGD
jgi:hypothetical protein